MWRLVASLALSASVWWAGRGRRAGGRRGVEGEAMEEAGTDPNKGNQTKRKKKGPYIHNKSQSHDQDRNTHNKGQHRDQGLNTDTRIKCQRTNLSEWGPYAQNIHPNPDPEHNHDTRSNCQRPKGPYGIKDENAELTTVKDTEQRRSQGQNQIRKQGKHNRATTKSKKHRTTTTQGRNGRSQSS